MPARLAGFWARCGIGAKLWLVFGMLFTIFGLAGGASYIGLTVVRQAEDDIQANMEIRARILEMEGLMEASRRLYRDFVLHLPEVDFAVARERYCQPSLALAARLIAVCEELKRQVDSLPPTAAIAARRVDIRLFAATAKRYSQTLVSETELLTTVYNPDSGIRTVMGKTLAELGDTVREASNEALLVREIDILEKRYEITRQRPSMQQALNKARLLRHRLDNDPDLTADRRERAVTLLDDFGRLADRLLEITAALQANANDFSLQAKSVDPIAGELKVLSTSQVAAAKQRIQWASRLGGTILIAAALLGMVCLLVAERVLQATITGKIVSMTGHAAALRAGHLDEMLPEDGRDELGELSRTFNAMTLRLRELVGTLEEKVRQRTRELAEKNRELDLKNRELATLSLTDRLTGLCNRRKLDQALGAELRRARRYGSAFALVMVDLDHFKDINDAFGHAVGDAVLVRAADILMAATRETDLVGRWGGEEFLIVCPETNVDEAWHMAEHLRREFEETVIPGVGRVTASFGLAAYTTEEKAADLVARADAALYRAKEGGRNRVAGDGTI
ncbi:MAG: diguanylate cyclase [Solidesulfovibrio sp. DCME]|uniref:GGDEF domain-containing protein n=1 Tax=Solidesulfovibrio sp. DCME TaxID=3447380 RepID=UPI003D139ECC